MSCLQETSSALQSFLENRSSHTAGKDYWGGNSLEVQWLGLRAFTAEGPGSIPGRETKIPQAVRHGQKKKKLLRAPKNFCMYGL